MVGALRECRTRIVPALVVFFALACLTDMSAAFVTLPVRPRTPSSARSVFCRCTMLGGERRARFATASCRSSGRKQPALVMEMGREFTELWGDIDEPAIDAKDFVPLPDKNDAPVIQPPKRYESRDWLHNLGSLPFSVTLLRIRSHLMANSILCVVVWLMQNRYPVQMGLITKGLNPSSHGLISGALGLMLVFRTNSAYDRYWEARKIWGGMISKLRELARVTHSSMTGWDREHFLQLMGAFPPILLQHLRTGGKGVSSQKEALKGLLSESDVEIVWSSRNRPYVVIKMLGAILRKAYTNSRGIARHLKYDENGKGVNLLHSAVLAADLITERQHAEHSLAGLTEAVGSAERIVKTTVPLSYSRHTSRFLSVWCFTLPLVLVEALGWRMIPCVITVTWALLSIEEVGNIIEDPFNMPFVLSRPMNDELKLERSFKNIRSDVMDRLPADSPFLAHLGGDFLCYKDYDVGAFHEEQRRSRGRTNMTNTVDEASKIFVWKDIGDANTEKKKGEEKEEVPDSELIE